MRIIRSMSMSFAFQGTLRPKNTSAITGDYLSELLDWLTANVNTNHATKLSDLHDVNLICNGVYLGDKSTAKDKRFLIKNGFTHVLNAAEGFDFMTQVDTSQDFYREARIKYLGIPGEDRPSWNISVYFELAAKFIDNAVKSGGKILVHCVVGISRSATLVLAYLMICGKMNAAEALEYVFKRRRIFPNIGFLHHLAQLNSVLRKNALLY
ncbi:dual specificity protein phosphatase 3 isoform X2 [Coccinella septempunctata]|uniref:dual specificity protein phosphatase 3 isoform X2 n=1 Tax=Coccinella septempunctata TaxID=41139 RepID=UPI001D0760AB|nr:dual specificity protein phosphatase 3 isoform X2 [Coccinella septempunctata]